jgi:DHA2 family multidrug resistance protein
VGYIAAKLCGFLLTPALFSRFRPLRVLRAAGAVLAVFSLAMACTRSLFPLLFFRAAQGAAGGILLVGGQTLLFALLKRKQQPLAQLFFAFGAVVAPATFVSFIQGRMVDVLAWEAIFLSAAALCLAAVIVLAAIPAVPACSGARRLDVPGFLLFAGASVCLTYIAQEGSRWNWFEAPQIIGMTAFGFAALLACVLRRAVLTRKQARAGPCAFDNQEFCFGFTISFVAGAALFGSAWLIPGFSLNVLDFTASEAGALVAPGGAAFLATLVLTALLVSLSRINPLATVPLGIVLIMAGMWLLSGSTSASGSADLFLPLLIRGAGLGFLFLSLTLYALGGLTGSRIAQGVALFTAQRQFGGLFGVAFLQRYLDHQNAANISILSSRLESGGVLLSERLQSVQAALQSRGMEPDGAGQAALVFLRRSLNLQGNTLSYNESFFALVLLFFIAAPALIFFKIWLSKRPWIAAANRREG